MTRRSEFAHAVLLKKRTEVQTGVVVAWFLSEVEQEEVVTVHSIVEFMEQTGLRLNINRTRFKGGLRKVSGVSTKGESVSLALAKKKEVEAEFGAFLSPPDVKILDHIIDPATLSGDGTYFTELGKQINACYQIGAFDGCAVLMRRLVEGLIIRGFLRNGLQSEISNGKNYKSLEDIIVALKSSTTLRTSRSSPKILDKVKALGDRAAHSTNYLTHRMDIDDLKADFRALVADLRLQTH